MAKQEIKAGVVFSNNPSAIMKKLSDIHYVIVGLGNPGEQYKETRHNAGRNAVRAFAEHADFAPFAEEKRNVRTTAATIKNRAVLLALPETFMNKSGDALRAVGLANKKQIAEKLIVVHDDLDLPLGTIRLVKNRGAAGHKGVMSIMRAAGTQDFMRIRIGIAKLPDIQKSQSRAVVHTIVVGKLSPREKTLLNHGVARAAEALELLLRDGFAAAMNTYNGRA